MSSMSVSLWKSKEHVDLSGIGIYIWHIWTIWTKALQAFLGSSGSLQLQVLRDIVM